MTRTAHIIVDLGFGDSGKGTVVDYLARSALRPLIVRFNGGAQAAHNVVTPDGRHHTFAQFGSGMFVPGSSTYLSRCVVVDPTAIVVEAAHLASQGVTDALRRLTIDRAARIVTPYHKAANRLREMLRGSAHHGSCGRGIGETMADSITFPHQTVLVADLRDPETLLRKLTFFRKLKYDEFVGEIKRLSTADQLTEEARIILDENSPFQILSALIEQARRFTIVDQSYLAVQSRSRDVILEGAQGVLLDEWHGFHPYTTWSTTTAHNAKTLLGEIGFTGTSETVGVLRTYTTRHGQGPFPTEDRILTALMPDRFNGSGRWQGDFRVGHLDLVLLRYAVAVAGGIDSLALTHMDTVGKIPRVKVCADYRVTSAALTSREKSMIVSDAHDETSRVILTSLKPKPLITDLTYQEALTSILGKSDPHLCPMPSGAALIEMIECELRIPVSIVSHGPSALEKYRRHSALRLVA